ncbi:class I SAM-dependent methyltransferase [Candidatus Peregrinibacteria bacterium]|nr:class I SAM-dependent methyltransferase [Candidatus Peregrinibacteria bacterium]
MFRKYKIEYNLDDPRTTLVHRDIILQKRFLKKLYQDWYRVFIETARSVNKGKYLEIGSGGGFLKDEFPEVITSDILDLPVVDKVFSAEQLPYSENELGCIMMLNVFHHIPMPWLFLEEAQRTLVKGGKIVMVEPANSTLGRFIYKRFHHEPFDPDGPWEIKAGNPLSHSNQALPYIYFERDKELFTQKFPQLKINYIKYHTPFLYVLSGGVSRTAMMPYFLYGFFKGVEYLLSPLSRQLGLFCMIEIEKI